MSDIISRISPNLPSLNFIYNKIPFDTNTAKFGLSSIIAIIIILIIYKFRKDYLYHSRNPVFHPEGVSATKKHTIDGSKIPNSTDGLDLSMFQWIYIDNMKYKYGTMKHVVTKGNADINSREQCPSIWIDSKTNNLIIIISTNTKNDRFIIPDYQIRKWFSVGIVITNTTVDIYVNGELVNSHSLSDSPKINNGDLLITTKGGYQGALSSLGMYSYSLHPHEIKKLHAKGYDNKPMYKRAYLKLKGLFYNIESPTDLDVIVDSKKKKCKT